MKKVKCKIAIITPEFSDLQKDKSGGLASFIDKFIFLIRKEYEIHIICSSNISKIKKYPKYFLHHVKVKFLFLRIMKYLDIHLINYIFYYPIQSFILNRYLKKINFKFNNYFYTNYEYVSLFQDKNIPSIVRISSLDHLWLNLNFFEKKISKYYNYLIFRKCAQIWCNSIFLAKKIKSFKKKIKIIPNFFNLKIKKNFNINNKKNFVLFVGTLNERKGILLVSSLFKNLFDKTNLRFVIIGKDTKRNFKSQFNKYFANQSFSKKLRYYGSRDKSFVFKFIRQARLVVIPSKIENAPNILQEVLINDGVPLCSDNSSMEEMLFNNKNFLFKNGSLKNFIFKAKRLINPNNKLFLIPLKKYKEQLIKKYHNNNMLPLLNDSKIKYVK